MTAKVQGTWNLHKLTDSLDLDHFVLFSSAASLVGSAGQINYAAANGFLDAIAHYRHQQNLPALSINWGPWTSGLATNKSVVQKLQRLGVSALETDLGFAVLDFLMRDCSEAQVGVLPGSLNQWIQSNARAREQNVSVQEAVQLSEEGIANHLLQQIAIVLGIKSSSIQDLSGSFLELGIDSLTAVELRNRLQTSFNCSLPATLLYDYPTISLLQNYLVEKLIREEYSSDLPDAAQHTGQSESPNREIENMSEGEALALLSAELNQLEI